MRGKLLADFPFDIEPERSLHAPLRQARQAKMTDKEVDDLVESDTNSDREIEDSMAEDVEERLFGDYGRANASSGRLTIVNQLVNVANFQLHPTTIRQLEKRPFIGKINENVNKHLQRFLTISTTLKIEEHSKEEEKLRMCPFTLTEDVK